MLMSFLSEPVFDLEDLTTIVTYHRVEINQHNLKLINRPNIQQDVDRLSIEN